MFHKISKVKPRRRDFYDKFFEMNYLFYENLFGKNFENFFIKLRSEFLDKVLMQIKILLIQLRKKYSTHYAADQTAYRDCKNGSFFV